MQKLQGLKKIKTCEGCKALRKLRTGNPNGYGSYVYAVKCDLGFSINTIKKTLSIAGTNGQITVSYPEKGYCNKPKTTREYIKLLER